MSKTRNITQSRDEHAASCWVTFPILIFSINRLTYNLFLFLLVIDVLPAREHGRKINEILEDRHSVQKKKKALPNNIFSCYNHTVFFFPSAKPIRQRILPYKKSMCGVVHLCAHRISGPT